MLKVRKSGFWEAFTPLWIALACLSAASLSEGQTLIPQTEKMPNLPQPYQLRDWHKVTRDYLEFIFDFDKRGDHLPLMRWKDESKTMIWMPAYVGNPDGPESINYLAALVSGSLVGLDMRTYRGHDWVSSATNFFSPRDGVFLDWTKSKSGSSFWYDVLPNVLFFQLADLYPDDPGRTQLMLTVAEHWYQALVALGGNTSPPALPNFDHTGFNLRTMQPFDNGHRIEPEGAAGIAFIEYLAWRKFKDARYLTAADWAIRALEKKPLEANPLYEVLLPYAALTAVRMNADLGRHYNVPKLVNWCFEPRPKPQARPNWGVITDTWNGLDVHGLVGSATDGGGYAFAMNTFQYAGTLAPLARYDDRYAHDLGKWILNLANAARLFYPNAHDPAHQSSHAWASAHDPESVIAYEGLRKWKRSSTTVALRDYATRFGRIKAGTYADTHFYGKNRLTSKFWRKLPRATMCISSTFGNSLCPTAPSGFWWSPLSAKRVEKTTTASCFPTPHTPTALTPRLLPCAEKTSHTSSNSLLRSAEDFTSRPKARIPLPGDLRPTVCVWMPWLSLIVRTSLPMPRAT